MRVTALLRGARTAVFGCAGSALLLVSPAALGHDDDDGSWEEVTGPSQGRWDAEVTVLDDGRVVVVGGTANGYDEFGTELASAEVYDPDSDEWTDLPSLPGGAHAMWSATLQSGEVLVAGGLSANPSGFPHFPATNSYTLDPDRPWKGWRATGPTPYGMWAPYGLNHAIVLDDGKVLVRGGIDTRSAFFGQGVSDQSAIYDPITRTWDVTRSKSGATVPKTTGKAGTIRHLTAEEVGGDATSDRLFQFTAGSSTFSQQLEGQYLHVEGASNPGNNGDFFVLQVADTNDSLIAFGLSAVDEVLGQSARWSVGGRKPQTKMPHTTVTGLAVKLRDGRVFVAGGHDQRGMDSPYAMLYSPTTGRWTEAARMPIIADEDQLPGDAPCTTQDIAGCALGDHAGARWGPVGGLLPDGTVLVTGGDAFNVQTGNYLQRTSAVRFHPSNGTWTVLSSRLSAPRIGGHTVHLSDDLLFVGGGQTFGSTELFDWPSRTFRVGADVGATHDLFGGAAVALPDGDVMALLGINWDTGEGSDQAFRYVTDCGHGGWHH